MRMVIDYTGKYEAKDGEHVVRANMRFFHNDDLKGFDAVCLDDADKDKIENEDIEVIGIASRKKRGSKK